MFSDGQTLHVLEDKGPGIEFPDDSHEVQHKPIARIVKHALPDQGKALTRWAAEHTVDWPITQTGSVADLIA